MKMIKKMARMVGKPTIPAVEESKTRSVIKEER